MEPATRDPFAALQQRLGHVFGDPALLRRALTHRSFAADHNERLEFLGDAVLGAAVAALLVARHPGLEEGDLTRMRAQLVREGTLHEVARQLDLGALLRLSEGERRSGGAGRPAALADALEALIAAVFLDAGFDAAAGVVARLFAPLLDTVADAGAGKDAKTALQEWLQARRLPVPQYEVVQVQGPQHAQTFTVRCSVPARALSATGSGASRRAAEQAAAGLVLGQLQEPA